jgi:DNA-binding transcriptional LysR family regulator
MQMADYLRALRGFCKVVECQGITRAADKLHVTKSLLSKQIKWLEFQLQSQLLDRTTRSIRPTHAGQKLFSQSKQLLKDWEKIQASLQDTQETLSGHVAIGSTHWYGHHVLNKHLIDYLKTREQASISFKLIDRPIDLVRDELDLCITSEPHIIPLANMQKIFLGHFKRRLIVSKQYLAQHGEPGSLDALHEHALITKSDGEEIWPFEQERVKVSGRFSAERMDCVVDAVKANLGIAYVVYSDELAQEKDLVTILNGYTSETKDLYLAYLDKDYISYLLEDCIDYFSAKLKV